MRTKWRVGADIARRCGYAGRIRAAEAQDLIESPFYNCRRIRRGNGGTSMTARLLIFAGSLLLALQVYPRTPAAQHYPYCALFEDGSSRDCGFSTLQMCEASVTGVGGLCINNPAGPPPLPPPQLASGPLQLPDARQAQQPLPPQQQSCNPLIDGTYCATQGGPINPPPMPRIQSMSSDLGIGGGDPPATLGAITFSGSGATCIGLFRRVSCGG